MSGSGAGMSNEKLLREVALLQWLSSQSDEHRRLLAALTGVQVAGELLERLSGQRRLDACKRECILSIAEFVRQNPKASQTVLNAEVEKQVLLFAARVKALDTAPLF